MKTVFFPIALTTLLGGAIARQLDQPDVRVQRKATSGRTTIELVGGCEYLEKIDCWDMTGKRNAELTGMVRTAAKEEFKQIQLGFRMLNRLVIYKQTHLPFFSKGSPGGDIRVESQTNDVWLRSNQLPGEKGARIEIEYRAVVVVAPKETKSLSIQARSDTPNPETSVPFRLGAEAKAGKNSVRVLAIRKATAAELKSMGQQSGWVIEFSQSAPVDFLDSNGNSLRSSSGSTHQRPRSISYLQSNGSRSSMFIDFDPKEIAKLKLLGNTTTRIEITGVPANPR